MAYSQAQNPTDEISYQSESSSEAIGHRYYISTVIHRFELTPLRVSLLYLGFGLVTLYFSDVILVRRVEEPLLSQLQAIKGAAEIIVTAGLIFGFTSGSRAPLEIKNKRLKRQREELQVLHRVLRHNLQNNLTAIQGYADLLEKRTNTEEREDWCEALRRSVHELLNCTNQASRIKRITSEAESSVIDLSSEIQHIMETHQKLDDSIEVSLDVPETARVRVHPMFGVALEELISNAVTHNDASNPELSISVEQGHGLLSETRIHLVDNGPGLPDHAVEVLKRSREDPLVHMEGLGLWMVHWITEESHGTMEVDTGPGGTRVTLTVPNAIELPTPAATVAPS